MIIDPYELGKWVLGGASTVFLGIGAFIGKRMSDRMDADNAKMSKDIEELKADRNAMREWMAEYKAASKGRESLQDERWKNQDSRWEDLRIKMGTMHSDVQAIVYSQMKGNAEKDQS